VIVSLNPDPAHEPDSRHVLREFAYAHPVFDRAAVAAQRELPGIQGRSHLWYCGAWARYGFHEDGLMSALSVVEGLRARWRAADGKAAA
jgi:predicted NAD/FAD-binding protein